ncbi:hypothetical protein QL285_029141 [Trifolium repens]|nr:hypothetical protein QL285_029141 [Trifolium repens]
MSFIGKVVQGRNSNYHLSYEKKKKDAEEQNSRDAMDAEDEVEQEKVLTVRHLNIAGLQSFKESGKIPL